jgi:hypothetical protein
VPARNSARSGRVITITSSFTCPECDEGVCGLPRPALVVSDGKLRPATDVEMAELKVRAAVSWDPVRLPGKGKEGLARLLAEGGSAARRPAQGFLITCSCGHLFLDELPRP